MKRVSLLILLGLMLSHVLVLPTVSDTQSGKWKKKADMPTARYDLATSVVAGKIYATSLATSYNVPPR